ncbi:MAG: alpha/beta hydrolase family protein [Myxococcota bacterium]
MTALALLSLTSCERFGPDDPRPRESGTIDRDDSGTTPIHTGESGDDTGGETGTTPPPPLSSYVYEVSREQIAVVGLDLVVVTYGVLPTNPLGGYRDNEGNDPLFHVVRPRRWVDPAAAHPALVWLHGGVLGIDDECPDPETIPEGEDDPCNFCRRSGVEMLVENAISGHEFILAEVQQRQWMMVVPENTWCDMWTGLGEDDPVDANHKSVQHIHFVLDVLEEGLDDHLADPAGLYLWGTSLGGSGAFPVAYGTGEEPSRFDGLVCDSGPTAFAWWDANSPFYAPYIEHLTGGPAYDDDGDPTPFWDNYARIDGTLLVGERGFRVPVFSAWNTYDQLTEPENGTALEALLPQTYGADGVRYWSHDYRHHAPMEYHHTQTAYRKPPWGYTPRAAFEFLAGRSVAFYEAEALCPTDVCVTQAETSDDFESISIYSGGAAVTHGGDGSPGVVFRGEVPDDVPRGVPMTLMLALRAEGTTGTERAAELLTATLSADGAAIATKVVTVAEIEEGDDARVERYVAHVDGTTWAPDLDGDGVGDPLPEGPLTIEVTHAGPGTIYFDGVWFLW